MLRTVKTRWGDCTYFLKDEYVGKSIHNYGEYNPDETEAILELSAGEGIALDIGANIGVMTMAMLARGDKVVAFEPQPEVFKLLEKNCPGASCYNCGLGDVAGTAKMPKVFYSEKGNFGGLGIGFKTHLGTIDVEVRRLDDFKFVDRIKFMKIDVEGYEENVLKGARETILKDKPIMYIEDDRRDKSESLRKYIRELGYSIEEHKPPLYREENFFGLKRNVWHPMNYASHNIICMPCS